MKRKLALIILALACAIACAFGLSACGGGGGGGDKTLTGIVIVDGSNVEHSTSYSLGEVPYGSQPDLSYGVYAKYSDNSKSVLNASDLTVKYYFESNVIAQPTTYEVGNYEIVYTYQNHTVKVTFTVTSSSESAYVLTITGSPWKYLEEPVITVTENGAPVANYSVYCITEEDYDLIKDANDFEQQLFIKRESYVSASTEPGDYYFFASVSSEYSNFVKVTIAKADITLAETSVDITLDQFTYGRGSTGKWGDLKLSEMWPTIYGPNQCFVNSLDISVEGHWEWVNPDEKVNSTNNGETRNVKYVPYSDCYNTPQTTVQVTLDIAKGRIEVPVLDSVETFYDGAEHEVILTQVTEWNYPYMKVTFNSSEVTLDRDAATNKALLGKVTDDAEYVYTLTLIDKVNLYWDNGEDYSDTTDVADKQVTYTVNKLPSWVNIFHQEGADDHDSTYSIDGNLEVRIKLIPAADLSYDSYTSSISPYATLDVEVLAEHNSNSSQIEATAGIINDGEYDWLVITATDFKGKDSGTLLLHFTGTGADHYADIDRVEYRLSVAKYRGNIACAIEEETELRLSGDTQVKELYELYPTLETALGKWVLYMVTGDEPETNPSDRLQLDLETKVGSAPSATINCMLMFEDNGFVDSGILRQVKPVLFTIIDTNRA